MFGLHDTICSLSFSDCVCIYTCRPICVFWGVLFFVFACLWFLCVCGGGVVVVVVVVVFCCCFFFHCHCCCHYRCLLLISTALGGCSNVEICFINVTIIYFFIYIVIVLYT